MFDIGFSEMLVIGLVALIVIGPERLPKVARAIGHLIGRAQRYVTDVKSEINREMELDELRKMQVEMQQAARKVETEVQTTLSSAEHQFNADVTSSVQAIEQQVNSPVQPQAVESSVAPSAAATGAATSAEDTKPRPVA